MTAIGELLPLVMFFFQDALPHQKCINMESSGHGLETLELLAKINLSFLRVFNLSCFVIEREKTTQMYYTNKIMC